MAISAKSLSDSDVQTTDYLNLEQVSVVITFRQTIEKFQETHEPSKLKWCNLTESDVRRFVYYDVIEPAEQNMGTQTVWQLQDWVKSILQYSSDTFNLTAKQIKEITRYADEITDLSGEFVGKETDLAGRSIGHLHEMGIISMVEDNRNKHRPTVWELSEKLQKLVNTMNHVQKMQK